MVNAGDKVTKEEKVKLKAEMQTKYGLDEYYVKHVLRLPPAQKVKIYDIDKIVNSRKKLSISEKIDQLKDFLAEGKAESFEDYKKLCGEIRGLLIMRGYTLDLKQRLETSDD